MVISATSRAMAAPSRMAMPASASESAGGIVDAVAQHHDPAAGLVLSTDEARLILRQDLGEILVHAHGRGDGTRRPRCRPSS